MVQVNEIGFLGHCKDLQIKTVLNDNSSVLQTQNPIFGLPNSSLNGANYVVRAAARPHIVRY